MSIPCDICYSVSHCSHQLHNSWPLLTSPCSPPPSTIRCNSATIGAPQFLLPLLSENSVSYIPPHLIPPLSVLLRQHRHSLISSLLITARQFHAAINTPISALLSLQRELPNVHWNPSVWIFAPILHHILLPHPSTHRLGYIWCKHAHLSLSVLIRLD